MKKSLLRGSALFALSALLCACSSSAPQSSAAGSSVKEDSAKTEPEQPSSTADQEIITFDGLKLSYVEHPNPYGYDSCSVTITNTTDYIMLNPRIYFFLEKDVTAEDIQAAMPEGLTFSEETLMKNVGMIATDLTSRFCLKPGETSEPLDLAIYLEPNYDMSGKYADLRGVCPATRGVMDLLVPMNLGGTIIVDDTMKVLSIGSPVKELKNVSDRNPDMLLNEIPESVKDLALVPEGTEVYTIMPSDNNGKVGYVAAFYNVGDGALEKYPEAMKEIFPNLEIIDATYSSGDDGKENYINIYLYPDHHVIVVSVN